MKRYQIYRRRIRGLNGKCHDGLGWVPFSSRLYKTRSYVRRKVLDLNLNLLFDGYFYKFVTIEQDELSL